MFNKLFECFSKKKNRTNSHVTFSNIVTTASTRESISPIPGAGNTYGIVHSNNANVPIIKTRPVSIPPSEKTLYIILPYFNYCHFHRRKELFLAFLRRICGIEHIYIVVAEAIEKGETSQFTKEDLVGVSTHLCIDTQHRIWMKENLINIAVQHLPSGWKYMAWIDADIAFVNSSWVKDTLQALEQYDVVQMFHTCVNMGPNEEALKIDKGFGYMYLRSGKPYTKTYKYGFWHPGFAWACSRPAYQAMYGLIDWGILGSGDHHMALALIGLVDSSHPGNIHGGYVKLLREYQQRVRGLRLGYVDGTIMHYWHGRIEDRKYRERWDILTKNKYDPTVDIHKTVNGVVQLTKEGERLLGEISEYFIGRREDNTKL